MTSDNEPPYQNEEMEEYAAEKGFHLTLVSPRDHGFAENYVKQLCKLVQNAIAGGKPPKTWLYNFLLHYHATPHFIFNVFPAKMLFNQKLSTKLHHIFMEKDNKENA